MLFGTGDDASIVGGIDRANKAEIGTIVIRGNVFGTASAGDHFGIVAEKIGTVRIADVAVALTNARNTINILDLTILEVV